MVSTARWDATGTSYLILNPEERVPDYIPSELEIFDLPENAPRPAKPQWVTIYIGKGKKDKLSKIDIAGFLYKKGNLAREDVGAIDVKDHYAFVAVRRQDEAIADSDPWREDQRDENGDRGGGLNRIYRIEAAGH